VGQVFLQWQSSWRVLLFKKLCRIAVITIVKLPLVFWHPHHLVADMAVTNKTFTPFATNPTSHIPVLCLVCSAYSWTSRNAISSRGLIHCNPGPFREINNIEDVASARGLSVAYLNVRHLPGKISRVRDLLAEMGTTVLHVSETWLNSEIDNNLLKIHGYKLYRFDRSGTHKSKGMVLYIHNSIEHLKPVCFKETDFTLIHTTINYQKKKYLSIGIYRPDQGASVFKQNRFLERLSAIVNSLDANIPIICKGDVNFDLLPTPIPARSRRVLSTFEELGLDQQISNPTRITPFSSTLIDWVCCNPLEFQHNCHTINFETHVGGDHQCVGIFLVKSRLFEIPHKHTYNSSPDFERYNSLQMRNLLYNLSWRDVELEPTLDKKYNLFEKKVVELLILCSPVVKARNCSCVIEKAQFVSKPWYTHYHRSLKAEVKRLHRTVQASINTDMYIEAHRNYRTAVNQYNTQCHIANKDYNISQIRNAELQHNARATNKIISGLMGKKIQHSVIEKIIANGSTYTSPNDISNILNDYFATIGLQASMAASNTLLPNLITNRLAPNLAFLPPGFNETYKRLKGVNPNKPSGPGGIPCRFFREFADQLVYIIEHIFAHCIYTASIPSKWKISHVTPIYKKKGSEYDPYNYRPIGITSAISKVFEGYICDNLVKHLETNRLLSDTQYGYRKDRSTLHAITHLTDSIRKLSDTRIKRVVGALFLDLSKAFDCVSHSLLIKMLPCYGLDFHAVRLMESFLTDRKQMVKLSKTVYSNQADMHCGVPQGSLLGPILFDLYINTLSEQVDATISQYADDTALIRSANNIGELKFVLQNDLQNLITYFKDLGLLLNVGKTDYLLFGFNGPGDEAQIILPNCPAIQPSNEVKYLGVTIDNKLNFVSQNKAILQKLKYATYTVRKLRPHLTQQSAFLLLNQLFYSFSDYCSLVWTLNPHSYLSDRLETQHRLALKVVLRKKRRTNCQLIYQMSGALTLFQRFQQSAAKFARNIIYRNSPQNWYTFLMLSEIPRGRAELRLINPVCQRNTQFTRETVAWKISRIWNALTQQIRTTNSKIEFIRTIRSFIRNGNLINQL
jgi:hypothetical protein